MVRAIALLTVGAVCGMLAVARAQAPAPAGAVTAYDGTYRAVSATRVNSTYTTRKGRTLACPNRRPGPIHIVNGLARYTTATGYKLRGNVGPQGQLAMVIEAPPTSGGANPIQMNTDGNVDAAGTIHARQRGYSCSYDFVWQKAAR
jgi:hypothetical protein